jgi:hypothetical protein
LSASFQALAHATSDHKQRIQSAVEQLSTR